MLIEILMMELIFKAIELNLLLLIYLDGAYILK